MVSGSVRLFIGNSQEETAMMNFHGAHIISADQFSLEDLDHIFGWARRMRKIEGRHTTCTVLEKYDLGNFFFEESTRTRLSSERAFRLLGGQVCSMTDMKFSSMVKGEDFPDCITTLSKFCDVMVLRCKEEGEAATAAKHSRVPIINGGDGKGEHPTQALLDLFTFTEERQGGIDGMTIAMVGDLKNGRTVHSLVRLLTLYQGITFLLVAPPEHQLPQEYLDLIQSREHSFEQKDNLSEVLSEADVFYMVRLQFERIEGNHTAPLPELFSLSLRDVETKCKADVVIQHPLPRNKELSRDIDGFKGAAYFRAIDNGILIRMALFILLLGKEEKFA